MFVTVSIAAGGSACESLWGGGMLARWMTAPPRPALEQAMDRFAAGDDAALGQVYDLAAPAVMTFLMGLTRDRQLAEDLTQETFLRIHRARGLFHPGAPVLPWAYTIARRLFLDDVRARRATRVVPHDPPPGTRDGEDAPSLDVAGGGPNAEELLADRELSQALDQALHKLPEAQASAFRLLKGEGLSVAEVATILGTTKGAVKLRAHRAYEALRGLLRADLRGRDGAANEQLRDKGEERKGSTR
jgi:RNA polymerase sigma-70 factor (ECF subfamily)